mmetsp:Transcript_45941/g.69289  ORF Transcript_45941/g.69289 Transcript_45941/m.69289 type:complete len:189 (-) Transcript_45941:79-645(-)
MPYEVINHFATTDKDIPKTKSLQPKHRKYVFVHDKVYSWLPATVVSTSSTSSSVAHDDATSTVTVRLALPSDWKENTYHPPRSTLARSSSNNNSLMRTVNLKDYPDFHLPFQNVDSNGILEEKEDIGKMKYVHEASVLYNLRERHKKGFLYTRVGEILVAMNPYEWFMDLYTKEQKMFYAKTLLWKGR